MAVTATATLNPPSSTQPWFKLRDRSETNESKEDSSRWSFKKKERSKPTSDSADPMPKTGGGLRFQMPKRKSSAETAKKTKSKDESASTQHQRPDLTKGVDTIVYSPASTVRGTPSSDQFFGSANTSPSYVTSPPPVHSECSSPVTFSPPVSPPPLAPAGTVATSAVHVRPRLSVVAAAAVASTPHHSVTAPACVVESEKKFTFQAGDFKRAFVSPPPPPVSPLSPTSAGNMSFLSVTPLSSPLRPDGLVKAHTDNLDRYIAEIEATESTGSLPVMPKKQQPYIRRRYTGMRHCSHFSAF